MHRIQQPTLHVHIHKNIPQLALYLSIHTKTPAQINSLIQAGRNPPSFSHYFKPFLLPSSKHTIFSGMVDKQYRHVIGAISSTKTYMGVKYSHDDAAWRCTRWGEPLEYDPRSEWLPIEYVTTEEPHPTPTPTPTELGLLALTRHAKGLGSRFAGREVIIHSIKGVHVERGFKSMNDCLRHYIDPTYNAKYNRNTTADFQRWCKENDVHFTRAKHF